MAPQELLERYGGEEGCRLPDEERFKDLTRFLRFFEFRIDTIEAKFNQNKPDEDAKNVIEGFRNTFSSEAADFMKRITKYKKE
jgi:predicted FMN-binding regulatory protein PaiB